MFRDRRTAFFVLDPVVWMHDWIIRHIGEYIAGELRQDASHFLSANTPILAFTTVPSWSHITGRAPDAAPAARDGNDATIESGGRDGGARTTVTPE